MSVSTARVLGAILLCAVASTTGDAAAQDRLDFKLGIGPTLNTHSSMDPGAHVVGAVEAYPWQILGLRLDGFVGVTNYKRFGWEAGEDPETVDPRWIDRGLEPLYSANLSLVVREPPGTYRLYGLLGLGWDYFEQWSQWHPAEHDFGTIFGLGLLAEIGDRTWFIELKGHAFGNVLTSYRTDTKSFAPLTVGLRF